MINSKIAKIILLPDSEYEPMDDTGTFYFMNVDDDFIFTLNNLPHDKYFQIENILNYFDNCAKLKNLIEIPMTVKEEAVDYIIDKKYAKTMDEALEKYYKEALEHRI